MTKPQTQLEEEAWGAKIAENLVREAANETSS